MKKGGVVRVSAKVDSGEVGRRDYLGGLVV